MMELKEKMMMSKPGIAARTHTIHLHTATGADGRKKKSYVMVIMGKEPENPQATFAGLLKDAKYVSYYLQYSSDSLESGSYSVYHVTAIYPSAEEQFETDIYGDQSNDYDD